MSQADPWEGQVDSRWPDDPFIPLLLAWLMFRPPPQADVRPGPGVEPGPGIIRDRDDEADIEPGPPIPKPGPEPFGGLELLLDLAGVRR